MTDWTGDEARRHAAPEPEEETAGPAGRDARVPAPGAGTGESGTEPSTGPTQPAARSSWFDPPTRGQNPPPAATPEPVRPTWLNTSTAGWGRPNPPSADEDVTQPHDAVVTPGSPDHHYSRSPRHVPSGRPPAGRAKARPIRGAGLPTRAVAGTSR